MPEANVQATPAAAAPGAPDPAALDPNAGANPPAVVPEVTEPPVPLELEAEKDDKKDSYTYEPTGESGLDLALTFVGKHGFGPGHPAMVAAVSGDFSILKAQLAEKNVPGAEAYLALAEKAYEKLHGQHEAQRKADREAIENIAGGPEAWAEVTTWAKANASEDEAKAVNGMLGRGGEEAKIAAGWLAMNYQRATGGESVRETEGAGPRVAVVPGKSSATTDALAPKDYAKAVADARMAHKGRGHFEESPEYAKLRERRSRFKG